ncbi:TonB-dependent receptor [Coraliomargarita parva]|uniref:TonB-dependent receptor n=1 Tax=Coraliomargarita parva TaxID=3014050 RepID=UPI0022B38652|nr:TonB-dependent receptor [Coraliomargarita parva]
MSFSNTAVAEEPVDAQDADSDQSGHFLLESVDEAEASASAFSDDLPAGHGLVSGQVLDKESGAPVPGVALLLEGTDVGTITDAQGRYTLGPAPAGKYTLTFLKTGYIEANITGYEVNADQVNVFPFALPPRPAEMSDEVYELQDFTVTAEEANDLMMKLDLKFDSDRALDVFSSEDFSKFAASDVADAVKRIAGVSVNDGKFPSVRGLNDRYTVTTLNGMPLPSPDPFRKSPQFDIFPSALLDSILVSKSTTAELSGESTAANFDLITKQMPDEFFLKVSFGTGWHSNSVDQFRSFDRGNDSYLYTDGASRLNSAPRGNPGDALADSNFEKSEQLVSNNKKAYPDSSVSISIGNKFDLGNDRRFGFVFSGYHKRKTTAILGAEDVQGYDFSGADRLVIQEVQLPPFLGGGTIEVPTNVSVPYGDETTYEYDEYEESVKLGALLGGALELGENNTLFGNFFISRTSDTTVTRNYSGVNSGENITPEEDLFLIRERLYYVERSLTLGQVGGEHLFPDTKLEPELNWALQRARTTQDEPDYRDTTALLRYSDFPDGFENPAEATGNTETFPGGAVRNINSDDNISLSSNSWRSVQEDEDSARMDLAVHPFEILTLEGGGLLRRAERVSDIQSYLENRADTNASGETEGGFGVSQNNLENGGNSIRGRSEATRDIDAIYLMAKLEPVEWVKFNLGYRFEDSTIAVDSDTLLPSANSLASVFRAYDQARIAPATPANVVRATEADVLGVPDGYRNTSGDSISETLEDRVYLPSAGLTLDPIPGIQFKFAYYETINRPSFREITSDIFIDIENGDALAGNPFLQSSRTDNFDFRFEIYPAQFEFDLPLVDVLFSGDDMFGVSLFRKEIELPIEFVRPTDRNVDEIPFNNPEGAVAEGIEFEFRKNFEFTGLPWGEYFSIGGNYAFTSAEAGVSEAEAALLGLNQNIDPDGIDDTRPLTEQPEQILNLDLSFRHPEWGSSVTLAYNYKSEILESIGSEESFDAYRGAVERLDLVVSHEFENGVTVSFAVKNLLDEGYETYFRNRAPDMSNGNISNLDNPSSYSDDKPRKTVDSVGRTYSLSVSYNF